MIAHRQRKNIHDLAVLRLYSHRRDQHHPRKNPRVGSRHFRRNKPARRKADHVDWRGVQFADDLRVKSGQVAIAANPIDGSGPAESRLKRDYQRALLCQALIPRKPARIAKLVVQDEQRFARAAANDGDCGARRADGFLGRGRHDVLLGLVRAVRSLFGHDHGRRVSSYRPTAPSAQFIIIYHPEKSFDIRQNFSTAIEGLP